MHLFFVTLLLLKCSVFICIILEFQFFSSSFLHYYYEALSQLYELGGYSGPPLSFLSISLRSTDIMSVIRQSETSLASLNEVCTA